MKLLSIFSLIVLSTAIAHAACDNVNLVEPAESPFRRIPIYDQGQLSTCYAYTASQMTDYERISRDPETKNLTNALWAALIHKIRMPVHWSPDSLDFSRLAWVFNSLQESGACRNSVVKKSIQKLRNGNAFLTDDDLLYFYDQLWSDYQKNVQSLFRTEEDYRRAYATVSTDKMFREKIQYSLYDTFHFITYRFEGERLKSIMNDVFDECRGDNIFKVSLPRHHSTGSTNETDLEINSAIENALDRHGPVGIGYCSDILRAGNGFRGLKIRPRMLAMVSNTKGCSAHYSVIAGKRENKNTGICEYLVRNTYGPDFWTDKWTCTCRNPKLKSSPLFDCKSTDKIKTPYEVVGCWIDSKELAENIFDVTHF